MDGVLVIDKPPGVTSHDVVAVARRSLREPRIGHTGTLDPLATGVLPLACGRATRLVRFLTAADKEYDATIRFGLTTDSYDVSGTEISRSGLQPTRERVEQGLAALRGNYAQVPPAYSAKRVGRERAYTMARRKETVELAAVPVRVTRAELIDFSGELAVVGITCSAGFYVRTFAHTLGELAGTGACLQDLRRTRSGDFDVSAAVALDDVVERPAEAKTRAIRMEDLLPGMKAVQLTDDGRRRVVHGREVEPSQTMPMAPGSRGNTSGAYAGWVRLFDGLGCLVALAREHAPRGALHPAIVLI